MSDDPEKKATASSTASVETQRKLAAARHRSNIAARVAAVVVALAALGIVLGLPAGQQRESTVTVTETRQDVQAGPSPGMTITNTEVTETPASDTSAFGQLLASPGAKLLLNVGLVALAAFLAGAVVQRVWLGEFGITVGPVEIPPLPAIEPEAVQQALATITTAAPFENLISLQGAARGPQPFPQYFHIHSPRLQFLSIRIELEQRIRELARAADIEPELTLDRLLRRLELSQIIDRKAVDGLEQLLSLGDQAAAGAEVPEATLESVKDAALSVLYALGELRRQVEESVNQPTPAG